VKLDFAFYIGAADNADKINEVIVNCKIARTVEDLYGIDEDRIVHPNYYFNY